MQSIYLFEQKQRRSENICSEDKKRRKVKRKHEKDKEVLASNYQRRISRVLLSLPQEVMQRPMKIRSESTKQFHTNYNSVNDRITSALNQNQWLDTTPTAKLGYQFRKRERRKELADDFHYRPRSGLERVSQTRESQRSFLQTSENTSTLYAGGRSLLGYYHPVAHTKTLQSFLTLKSPNHYK